MLDVESAKELIRMCRAGKLYDIEQWIADGKSLDVTAASRRRRPETLLEVAVETGFHSLVDLVSKNEQSADVKTAALCAAVSAKRMDLIELLCGNGADPQTVPLDAVLSGWDPKLIRYFLDRGADPLEGRPFAEAFRERIRTALRPFIDYKLDHPEFAPQLQEQIDCALRYFCGEGDLKWVCLLLWAGADPRSKGPCLGKDWTEDSECYTTGLEEACRPETIDVLKKLKPDPKRENVTELLHNAAMWSRSATLECLLELGSNPNDKANGGSSALDMVLRNLDFIRLGSRSRSVVLTAVYEVRRVFDCLRALVSHGAAWRPESSYGLNSLRRALEKCQPEVSIELLRLFREFNACPASETLLEIAADPRHLGARIDVLAVLHTWSQNLRHHPHLHCLVPAGGLTLDNSRWITTRRRGFFLPVRVLSRMFRGKLLAFLKQSYRRGALCFAGKLAELSTPCAFHSLLGALRRTEWVVYSRPPFGGPEHVLKYPARYTHRVAISNGRLLSLDNGQVRFR